MAPPLEGEGWNVQSLGYSLGLKELSTFLPDLLLPPPISSLFLSAPHIIGILLFLMWSTEKKRGKSKGKGGGGTEGKEEKKRGNRKERKGKGREREGGERKEEEKGQ